MLPYRLVLALALVVNACGEALVPTKVSQYPLARVDARLSRFQLGCCCPAGPYPDAQFCLNLLPYSYLVNPCHVGMIGIFLMLKFHEPFPHRYSYCFACLGIQGIRDTHSVCFIMHLLLGQIIVATVARNVASQMLQPFVKCYVDITS